LTMKRSRRHLAGGFALVVVLVGLLLLLIVSQPRPQAGSSDSADDAVDWVSRRQEVPLGEPLSVARPSPARWILGDGFLAPDAEGSWLAQTEGVIRFRVDTGEPVSVEIHVRPLLGRGSPTRDISVSSTIDHRDLALTGGTALVLLALDGTSPQEVRFQCSDTDSPQGLQINPDQRRFCFKLLTIQVNAE